MTFRKTRILVLGGGFGGLYAALRNNALQPDPAEIVPVDPLTNQPFSGSADEAEHKVQL